MATVTTTFNQDNLYSITSRQLHQDASHINRMQKSTPTQSTPTQSTPTQSTPTPSQKTLSPKSKMAAKRTPQVAQKAVNQAKEGEKTTQVDKNDKNDKNDKKRKFEFANTKPLNELMYRQLNFKKLKEDISSQEQESEQRIKEMETYIKNERKEILKEKKYFNRFVKIMLDEKRMDLSSEERRKLESLRFTGDDIFGDSEDEENDEDDEGEEDEEEDEEDEEEDGGNNKKK